MNQPADPQKVALKARAVEWDWTGLPMHYLDENPFATHCVNALNMLLPEGEVFFVQVFQQALRLIQDDSVHEDVVGFIGQEAVHSSAHQSILDHFAAEGLDTDPYVDQLRWFFRKLLGDRELSGSKAHSWLLERVAAVAALEHFTSYLGDWGLNARAWDHTFEPRVLDLVRWHLAEEVEHRHVAFDLFTHLDGTYRRRVRAYLIALPTFGLFVYRGVRYMATLDPDAPSTRRSLLREYCRAYRRGLIPSPRSLARMAVEYFRPSYHPSRYGSTSQAVAYLASSPAALAAG